MHIPSLEALERAVAAPNLCSQIPPTEISHSRLTLRVERAKNLNLKKD